MYSLSQEIALNESFSTLQELGFDSVADYIAECAPQNKGIAISDIEKARCELSEEEFSHDQYIQAVNAVHTYYGALT